MSGVTLVLGATGMVGRRLIPQLAERGELLRAASRAATSEQAIFDWSSPETFDRVLGGVESIYFVPPPAVDALALAGRFLDIAEKHNARRIVAVSSMAVEFPSEPLDSPRRALEALIRGSGMEWTILRPSGFAQNFSEAFLRSGIVHQHTISTATGEGAVAFVDAGDIAAVAAAALTEPRHAGKTYELTGPEPLTFADAARIIGKTIGRPIAYRALSSEQLMQVLLSAGLPATLASTVVRDQEAIRAGAGARVTDTITAVTGRAATRFEDFAANAAHSWARA